MKRSNLQTACAAAVALLMSASLATLTGCQGETEADLLAKAQRHVEKREARAALVQLRHAIQQFPQSAQVRLAMGRALLDNGDAVGAAVELEKALGLNAPRDVVVPLLARSLLQSGEPAKAVARFADAHLESPSAQADVLSSVAAAQMAGGHQRAGDTTLARALAADPQSPWALTLKARRQAESGDLNAALESTLRAQVAHPDKAALLQFEGDLRLQNKEDPSAAEKAYKAALLSKPDFAPAHAALVRLALQKPDLELGRQRLEAMVKASPKHPMTWLLQGHFALADGKLDVAEEQAQQLLRTAPDDTQVLMLAGEAAARKGAWAQAEKYLGRVIQRAPQAVQPRKVLAQAQLRSGDAARALDTLKPLLERKLADGPTLALAAQAHLKEGRTDKAQAYFRRAAELSPDDTRIRAAATLALKGKDREVALRELERVASKDPGTMADLVLVSTRLQQQDAEGAMRAVKALEAKQPESGTAANLEGRIHLMQGRTAEARQSLERSARLEPTQFAPVAALAAMDSAEGRPQEAMQRLEALLQRDPNHAQALLALAALKARHGTGHEQVEEVLQRAVKAAPDSVEARTALVQHYARQRNADGALKAARDAVAAMPDKANPLSLLAQVQMSAGEVKQGMATLRKLVAMDPSNAAHLMMLADAMVRSGDAQGLRQTLQRALESQPDLLDAQRALIALELKDGRQDAARAVARVIQQQRPSEAIGTLLEGDVAAYANAWPAAVKAYRKAQKAFPGTETTIKLHGALLAAQRKDEAAQTAQDWERQNPDDAAFQIHLGTLAAAANQWAAAERHFARAERAAPDNPVVLNNLAYALAKQNKTGAVERAERASRLLPDQSSIMDTLAQALAAERNIARALEVQRKAVERDGARMPELRLTLARLYLQAGEKGSAREQLQSLTDLGSRFPAQQEVSALLRQI